MSATDRTDCCAQSILPIKKLKQHKILITVPPRKLTIYSQNISGGRGKIYRINDYLANTQFDIIAIQETWFDHSVSSDEITASIYSGWIDLALEITEPKAEEFASLSIIT